MMNNCGLGGSLHFTGIFSSVCGLSRFWFWVVLCVCVIYFEFHGSQVAVLRIVGVKSDVVTTWEGRTSNLGVIPVKGGGEIPSKVSEDK
jgi:hypothetical protein